MFRKRMLFDTVHNARRQASTFVLFGRTKEGKWKCAHLAMSRTGQGGTVSKRESAPNDMGWDTVVNSWVYYCRLQSFEFNSVSPSADAFNCFQPQPLQYSVPTCPSQGTVPRVITSRETLAGRELDVGKRHITYPRYPDIPA